MANRSRFDVVGVGCCAFDIVTEVDAVPGPDDKVPVRALRTQGGGLVATGLVAAARLGGRCAYLGALGDDQFSQFCVDDFDREGVETRFIRRVPGASVITSLIVACPAGGTRMILAACDEAAVAVPEDVPAEVVRSARVLHVDNFQPEAAVHAARTAREAGVPVVMDLEGLGRGVEELLPLGTHVIVPAEFARRRYGTAGLEDGARALWEEIAPCGAAAAVATGGAEGSFAVWKGGELRQAAYRVPVVDTTGCGDVFHGAFAYGLSQGWELARILPFAAATAALKCRQLGGRAGIPRGDEVGAFLASAGAAE
ncbi:MAG: carbohydrate kinase family protein [Candidatus Brocadiaceae bacterium]|nr:carbohydrate kinase family protein [Candidatus Brocadiaceae bacterium]